GLPGICSCAERRTVSGLDSLSKPMATSISSCRCSMPGNSQKRSWLQLAGRDRRLVMVRSIHFITRSRLHAPGATTCGEGRRARGLSLAVNRAGELGAPGVQLASAGNAALALAAYAAAAGLRSRVALPSDTPRTVFERCREHGAEVLDTPGTLVDAARLLEAA